MAQQGYAGDSSLREEFVMGFLPDNWTKLSELDRFPYLAQCMEQGIISVEGLLGQCMAEPSATKQWLGCTEDEWTQLLVLLIREVPEFAWDAYRTEIEKYSLGLLPPIDLDDEEQS